MKDLPFQPVNCKDSGRKSTSVAANRTARKTDQSWPLVVNERLNALGLVQGRLTRKWRGFGKRLALLSGCLSETPFYLWSLLSYSLYSFPLFESPLYIFVYKLDDIRLDCLGDFLYCRGDLGVELSSVVNGANGAVQGLNWFNFRPFLTNQLVRGLNWFKPIVNWLTNSLPSLLSEPIKEWPR